MAMSLSISAQPIATSGFGGVQIQGGSSGLRIFFGPNASSHLGNVSNGFTTSSSMTAAFGEIIYSANIGDTIYAGTYDCNGNYFSAGDIVSKVNDTLQFSFSISCIPHFCKSVGELITTNSGIGSGSYVQVYNLVDSVGLGTSVAHTVEWSNGHIATNVFDTAHMPIWNSPTSFCLYQSFCGPHRQYCDSIPNSVGNSACNAMFMFDTINLLNTGASLLLLNMSGTPSSGPLDYTWDWGDGNISTGAYPAHIYADTGFYRICLTVVDSLNFCSDTYCHSFRFDLNGNVVYKNGSFKIVVIDPATIGQDENSLNNMVDFYPNPSDSKFWIESASNIETVLVYSLSGELVRRISSDQIDGQRVEVSIQNSGLYVIEVHNHNGIVRKKMLIQN